MSKSYQQEDISLPTLVVILLGLGILGVMVVMAVVSISRSQSPYVTKDTRIDNVARVLTHDPTKFTIYQLDKDKQELVPYAFNSDHRVQVLCDVPPEEAMWAVYNAGTDILQVHIHEPADINGAEWVGGHKNRTHRQIEVVE